MWVCLCARTRASVQQHPTLCYPMEHGLPGFSSHGIFPGKNTGVGCHFLLQGIFLTHGWNLCLLHCRWIISWVTREVLIVYKIYNYMLLKLRYSSIMIPTVFSLVFLKLSCWLKSSFRFLSFIRYYGKKSKSKLFGHTNTYYHCLST